MSPEQPNAPLRMLGRPMPPLRRPVPTSRQKSRLQHHPVGGSACLAARTGRRRRTLRRGPGGKRRDVGRLTPTQEELDRRIQAETDRRESAARDAQTASAAVSETRTLGIRPAGAASRAGARGRRAFDQLLCPGRNAARSGVDRPPGRLLPTVSASGSSSTAPAEGWTGASWLSPKRSKLQHWRSEGEREAAAKLEPTPLFAAGAGRGAR